MRETFWISKKYWKHLVIIQIWIKVLIRVYLYAWASTQAIVGQSAVCIVRDLMAR